MCVARILHAGLWDYHIRTHSHAMFSARQRHALGASSMRLRHNGIRSHRVHHIADKEFSLLIGPIAHAVLIQLFTLHQAIKREARIQIMGCVIGHGMSKR